MADWKSLKKVSGSLVRPNCFRLQAVDALGRGLSPGARQALTLWLGGCAGWVFSMVVLGGMTRLTRSGLSMTDWKFTGERAPRSQVEPPWSTALPAAKYMQADSRLCWPAVIMSKAGF